MELLLLSMLGLGVFAGLMDVVDQNEQQDAQDQDPAPAPPESTPDLIAPEPLNIGENAVKVTNETGPVNDSGQNIGRAYNVTDNAYNIQTGDGDDTLVFDDNVSGSALLGDGNDTAWGGEGRDAIRGEAGDDSLYGGGGGDTLIDIEGNNIIFGGDGDDFLRASNGSTMVGGSGADSFDLYLNANSDEPLRVLDFDPETDQIKGIRFSVTGTDDYDLSVVVRDDGDGVNVVSHNRVLAEVFGASVDDFKDIPVQIHLNGGTFTDDDGSHFINGSFNLSETIHGRSGDDFIIAGPGDVIDAGDGNDVILTHGQFASDIPNPTAMSTVSGGAGDDIIISTNGNVLSGGEGADRFALSLSQYSGGGTESGFNLTASVITDFDPAQDVIHIESGFIEQAGGNEEEPEKTLSIQPWSDGAGADILAGKEVIARVTGGQTLRVEDLVISVNGHETDLLGWH